MNSGDGAPVFPPVPKNPGMHDAREASRVVEMLPRFVKALSSLRLTVVVLACGIVLVFLGTLAQEPMGLYLVQERFFKSFFVDQIAFSAAIRKASHLVFINLDPLPPEAYEAHPRIPVFPGGYLIGAVLLANLLAAHISRLRLSWNKTGILLTHAGIVLMILGQVFTDLMSNESMLSFSEGETRAYSEHVDRFELVFARDVPGSERELVVALPAALLANGSEVRRDPLPFTVRVQRMHPNAKPRQRAPMVDTNREPAATQGVGRKAILDPLPLVRDMDHRNVPGAVVELVGPKGSMGTWMVWGQLSGPQEVEVGGETWRMELRPERLYNPFTLTLLKINHEVYRGTEIPRNFQSRVRIDNPGTGEHREVDIYMNNPLRYGGLTFYQNQMNKEVLGPFSGLQVVRNPSWLTPYVSTAMVFGGMLLHFLIMLAGFVSKSAAGRSGTTPAGAAASKQRNLPV